LIASLCLMCAACATIGPPLPPSLELPKPPTDLRAVRKGNQVRLTWTVPTTTTDRQRVRSVGVIRVCRGLDSELKECGTAVGEAPPPARTEVSGTAAQKIQSTYTDTLPKEFELKSPLGFATYAVEVLNAGGRGAGLSNQVKVPLVTTLPSPTDFAAVVSDRGVVLTWSGFLMALTDVNPVRYLYRVYRRQEGSAQEILVGELGVGAEAHPSVVDQSFEWEKTYYYHLTTLTVIASLGKDEVLVDGDDTPEVKVFAHDVFPPAVPSGLEAVFSGPGQQAFIDLIWSPVLDVDLAGYNVYRREEGADWVKLNTEPITAPAYRDPSVTAGKSYSYAVSAVDVRGNESTRSGQATESVPRSE
jgi:hypothetical protein